MKLYITDEGDPSVGIFSQTYTVETPCTAEYPDDMAWFKDQMKRVYGEFAEGRLTMWYESECGQDTDCPEGLEIVGFREDWEMDEFDSLFQCVKQRMSQ